MVLQARFSGQRQSDVRQRAKGNQLERTTGTHRRSNDEVDRVFSLRLVPGLWKADVAEPIAAMDMLGYQGGFLRKPLQPLSEQHMGRLKDVLKRCGALTT